MRFTTQIQTCLATNKVVAVCENLLQKVEGSSTFATKLVYVARFTGPGQTCFAASDVTPMYGVTPAFLYPIRSQYLRNLQKSLFVARQV